MSCKHRLPRLDGEPLSAHRLLVAYAAEGPGRGGIKAFVSGRRGAPPWRTAYAWSNRYGWRSRLAAFDRARDGSPSAPATPPEVAPVPTPAVEGAPAADVTDAELMRVLLDVAGDRGQRASARLQAAERALALRGRVPPKRPSRTELKAEAAAAEAATRNRVEFWAARLMPAECEALLAVLEREVSAAPSRLPALRLSEAVLALDADGSPFEIAEPGA